MHWGADCPADRPTENLDRRCVSSQGDRTPDGGGRLRFRVAKSRADVGFPPLLAHELHEGSRFAEIPFSQNKCQRGLMRVIKAPVSRGLLMAIKAQGPVGFLYCTGSPIITVYAFCVSRRWRGAGPFERRDQMGKGPPGPRDYDPCNLERRHPPHRPLFASRRLFHHRRQLRPRSGWGGQIVMSAIGSSLVCAMALAGMGVAGSCATWTPLKISAGVRVLVCRREQTRITQANLQVSSLAGGFFKDVHMKCGDTMLYLPPKHIRLVSVILFNLGLIALYIQHVYFPETIKKVPGKHVDNLLWRGEVILYFGLFANTWAFICMAFGKAWKVFLKKESNDEL